jgi:glycosyltransferase involved in cell wall biosynthesis
MIQMQVPVIFCGGGEGAEIVERYQVGITSPPGDYNALENSIVTLKKMPEGQYNVLRSNCALAFREHLNFDRQIGKLIERLNN